MSYQGNNLSGLAAGLFSGWQMYQQKKTRESEDEERKFQRGRQEKADDLNERQFGLQGEQFGFQRKQHDDNMKQKDVDNQHATRTLEETTRSNKAGEAFKEKELSVNAPLRAAEIAARTAAAKASQATAGAMNDYRTEQANARKLQTENEQNAKEAMRLLMRARNAKHLFDDKTMESTLVLTRAADPMAGGIPHRPPNKQDVANVFNAKYGESLRKNVGQPVGELGADLSKLGITPADTIADVRYSDMKVGKNGKGIVMVEVDIMTPNGKRTVVEPITELRSFKDDDKVKEFDLEKEAETLPALIALREELEKNGITAENAGALEQELAGIVMSFDPKQEKALQALGVNTGVSGNTVYNSAIKIMAEYADAGQEISYQEAVAMAQQMASTPQAGATGPLAKIPGQDGSIPGLDAGIQPGQTMEVDGFKITALPN